MNINHEVNIVLKVVVEMVEVVIVVKVMLFEDDFRKGFWAE